MSETKHDEKSSASAVAPAKAGVVSPTRLKTGANNGKYNESVRPEQCR